MRLIDADELRDFIYNKYAMSEHSYCMDIFLHELHNAPTLELSESLVTCAECKWGKPYSDKQLECDAPGLGGLKFPR